MENQFEIKKRDTCSITNPKDGYVTFARTKKYLDYIMGFEGDLSIYVPFDLYTVDKPSNIILIPVEDPIRAFILHHNEVNSYKYPSPNKIHESADIHESASIGNDGMRYIPFDDNYVSMKHMGNVVIGRNVVVNAFSAIARATLDSTIICQNVKIGTHVSIGHNCFVGKNTVIVDGCIVGGSSNIGQGCFLGLNSTIRSGCKVADHTLVGCGANVVSDITEKNGVYAGNPAKRIKQWDGTLP